MLPELPKARQRMLEMWNKTLFACFHRSDSFASQIPVRVQKEGHAAFLGGSETKYEKHSATMSFPARDAEGMSVEEFIGSATKLGMELGGQQAKEVFEAMSKPSPRAMPLQWEGPLSFQMVLDTWEKMEVDFGKDGLPEWPTIVLNKTTHTEFKEKLPKWMEDPEYKLKWAELVKRKRKEFDEREARRRLVD